ncbi:hypothetical protein BD779DRAFT_1517218 [Infundibulicybe gibba]|nr:hypothetical protein BD779DRAFT_1517218 [Infundibulicybe gibba]
MQPSSFGASAPGTILPRATPLVKIFELLKYGHRLGFSPSTHSLTMSPLPGIPKNIALLTGPPLLGVMFNWWILGILIVQCYIYRLTFPEDTTRRKSLVYVLLFLETVQTMLSTADAFHWFAFGFGNMDTLAQYFLANFDTPILGSAIALIVQLMFCNRVWTLSKSKLLTGFIALFSVVQLAGGIGVGVLNQQLQVVTDFQDRGLVYIIFWLGGSAITDTLIAVSLTCLLLRSRSQNYRTNDIILKIIRLTVETNSLTAFMAIIALATMVTPAIAPPKTTIFMCPCYILGKLYSNTFLTMLNNRAFIRNGPAFVGRDPPQNMEVWVQSQTTQINDKDILPTIPVLDISQVSKGSTPSLSKGSEMSISIP